MEVSHTVRSGKAFVRRPTRECHTIDRRDHLHDCYGYNG